MTESQEQPETGKADSEVDAIWQYTRCPECQAVFRIDQNKLFVRQGEVRCGACRVVFHAPSNKVFRNHGGGFSALITETVEQDTAVKMVAQGSSMNVEITVPDKEPFNVAFTAPIDGTIESTPLFSEKNADDAQETETKVNNPRLFGEGNISDEDNLISSSAEQNAIDTGIGGSIPKISSEPLVSRSLDDVKNNRKEPALSSAPAEKSVPSVEIHQRAEKMPADKLLSDPNSVEVARATLIYQPLSEAKSEIEAAEVTYSLPSDEGQNTRWSDAAVQPFGASAMPMPPQFEPFVPAASEVSEREVETQSASDHWRTPEDSLLDHNPFISASVEAIKPKAEIKMEPRPAAINMSGVDEYIVDRPNPLAGFFWFLVSAAFVVLLGLQVKYFLVERFAQNEAYRPYLKVFCGIARCELSPRRDAYRFTITQTRVDLHPQEPGALRITVRLLNQAKFAQPYPELRLTLTDRVGRVVGRRKFDPDFYLPTGAATRLASGELGYVVFDLAQPHEKAVGFVVDVVRRPS